MTAWEGENPSVSFNKRKAEPHKLLAVGAGRCRLWEGELLVAEEEEEQDPF